MLVDAMVEMLDPEQVVQLADALVELLAVKSDPTQVVRLVGVTVD